MNTAGERARIGALVALVLVAVCACEREDATPSDVTTHASIVQGIDARRASLDVLTGTDTVGETQSRFQVYSDSEGVVLIEEELSGGDYGTARARFYFRNNQLVHYVEESQRRRVDAENPARLVPVRLTVSFDRKGQVLATSKTADGTPQSVAEFETTGPGVRAERLIALARRSGSPEVETE